MHPVVKAAIAGEPTRATQAIAYASVCCMFSKATPSVPDWSTVSTSTKPLITHSGRIMTVKHHQVLHLDKYTA